MNTHGIIKIQIFDWLTESRISSLMILYFEKVILKNAISAIVIHRKWKKGYRSEFLIDEMYVIPNLKKKTVNRNALESLNSMTRFEIYASCY